MNDELLAILRCPCCGGALRLESSPSGSSSSGDRLLSACGRQFGVVDGIPDLVYPVDERYLDEDADTYGRGIDFIARLLNVEQQRVRTSLVELLNLKQGERVLEVACGPGSNVSHLKKSVGPRGHAYALDISLNMIRAAQRHVAEHPAHASVTFVRGNGCYLPFADASVNALLHVGTLNRFSDIGRALAEMARVVKIGGIVVAADEGVAPWLKTTEYGQTLSRFGSLFEGSPPLSLIPAQARDVTLRWLPGQAYFAITFRVDAEPPRLNLDVPLPGRRETVRDVLESIRRGRPDD